MADNITLNAGSGGSTLATDEISSAHYQRVKLIHGADGANAGDVSTANGLPVNIVTTDVGALTVAVGSALPAGANNIGSVKLLDSAGSDLTVAVNSDVSTGRVIPVQCTEGNVSGTPNWIGCVSLAAGRSAYPPKTIYRKLSGASTNATHLSAGGAALLYDFVVSNSSGAAVFLKLYNMAGVPTVGSSTIAMTVYVPTVSTVHMNFGDIGLSFDTGLSFALTTAFADADTGAVGAGDVSLTMSYEY